MLRRLGPVETIAECDAVAGLPSARLGLSGTRDGLAIYTVECPGLYDRTGIYGSNGKDWPDNDVRFARFCMIAAALAAGQLDQNWSADLVHAA